MNVDAEECSTCGGPFGDGPGLKHDYCPQCDMYWGDPSDPDDGAPIAQPDTPPTAPPDHHPSPTAAPHVPQQPEAPPPGHRAARA